MPESPKEVLEVLHKAKVSSVLLPIYEASKAQCSDTFKGYDKITTSPMHGKTLPKWNVKEEMKAKYRSMY